MASMQSARRQKFGENDTWIAATALVFGATLIGREKASERAPQLRYDEF